MLDAEVSAPLHIDGPPGFYLAQAEADAEYFASRRAPGAVLPIELSFGAVRALLRAGAIAREIPGRPPPFFAGRELFVPFALFALFNALSAGGEISVAK